MPPSGVVEGMDRVAIVFARLFVEACDPESRDGPAPGEESSS